MNGEIITIYLPIFEETLAKLEARGQGNTDEAARLRRVTRWTNSDQPTAAETETQAAA